MQGGIVLGKCSKLLNNTLYKSIVQSEKALLSILKAFTSLCEKEIEAKIDKNNLWQFIFFTLFDLVQLQKLLLRKYKCLLAASDYEELQDLKYRVNACKQVFSYIEKLKYITNSIFLTPMERMEVLNVLEENRQLYEKRMQLFAHQFNSENNPATIWLSKHVLIKK